MSTTPLLDINNARTATQREKMQKLLEEGKCPFCLEHLEEYHDNPIEWEKSGKYWKVTKNDYPYAPAPTKHYLLIYSEHVEGIAHIPPEAASELLQIIEALRKQSEVDGATLMMRFGSSTFTGATVSHLHAHALYSEAKTPESQPIFTVVGWQK